MLIRSKKKKADPALLSPGPWKERFPGSLGTSCHDIGDDYGGVGNLTFREKERRPLSHASCRWQACLYFLPGPWCAIWNSTP